LVVRAPLNSPLAHQTNPSTDPPRPVLARARRQIPALDEEFGQDAAAALAQLVGSGKRLRASVIGRERPVGGPKHPARAAGKMVVVLKEEGAERSINAEMLAGACGAQVSLGGAPRVEGAVGLLAADGLGLHA